MSVIMHMAKKTMPGSSTIQIGILLFMFIFKEIKGGALARIDLENKRKNIEFILFENKPAGQTAFHIGFSLHLRTAQDVGQSKITLVGPWETQPKSDSSLFLSGLNVDGVHSNLIVPRSGIYFATLKLQVSSSSSDHHKTTCTLRSSLSNRVLRAVSNGDEDGDSLERKNKEIFLSASLRLSIGEKLQVWIKSSERGLKLETGSLFSLLFQGDYGLLPSFLASPVKSQTFTHKEMSRIPSWKTHHKSSTGFSVAAGIFVSANTGNYLCSLNLILERAVGVVVVEFRTGKDVRLSLRKTYDKLTSTTLSVSQMFRLNENEAIALWLQPLTGSFTVSDSSTFSCFLVGKEQRSVRLVEPNITTMSDALGWNEISFWKVKQKSTDFRMWPGEGKIFFPSPSIAPTSIAVASLSLTVESSENCQVSIALLSGGVADRILTNTGRSLVLKNGTQGTLTLVAVLKVATGSYISAFVKSSKQIQIVKAEANIVRKIPIVPSIMTSCKSGQNLDNRTKCNGDCWSTVALVHEMTQQSTTRHWYIARDYFSPEEDGIYYVSINLIIDVVMTNTSENSLIEAELVSKSKEGAQELQRVFRGVGGSANSVHLMSTHFLQAHERLSIAYRCDAKIQCRVSVTSRISAVLMARTFLAEGFSTKLDEHRSINVQTGHVIRGWTKSKANYMMTSSFNADEGEYAAAYSGIYMVTCSILLRNLSRNIDVRIQLKIGDESKSFVEDISREMAAFATDYGTTLSLSSSIKLEKGQKVSIRLVTKERQTNLRILEHSTLSILAITQPGLPARFGFTMSMRTAVKVYRSIQSSQKLQGWTTYNLNGAFSAANRAQFQFIDTLGRLSVSKAAVLLLSVTAHLATKSAQRMSLRVNVHDNEIFESVDAVSPRGTQTMKLSVALFVQAGRSISVEVKAGSRSHASPYYVWKDSVISAVFLDDVPLKPGLMLAINGLRTSGKDNAKINHFKFQSDVPGSYKQNLVYKDEGFFEIPFSGNYIVSLTLEVGKSQMNTSVNCGMLRSSSRSSSEQYRLTNLHGPFQLTKVLQFDRPGKLSFVCQSKGGSVTLKKTSNLMINFLEYSRVGDVILKLKTEKESDGKTRLIAKHSINAEGPYLLAINTKRHLSSFSVNHGDKTIIHVQRAPDDSKDSVFFALNLQRGRSVDLRWLENDQGSNNEDITFYKVNYRSLGGLAASTSKNEAVLARNLSWALITSWDTSLPVNFLSLKNSYLSSTGLFISKEDATYLVTVVVNFVAKTQSMRYLYLVIDGVFSKTAQRVPVCNTAGNAMCTVTLTTSLHLQKWQSLGVYIHFATFYDEVVVLNGSRLSILLLDISVDSYKDNGPNVVVQPWPKFVNESKIFNWSCDAIGSQNMEYSWRRINLDTNRESFMTKGKTITLFGRPEESGYYYCSVAMNGTVHSSQVSTFSVSDTNECTSNKTEHQNICHKNANCINTIGSYYCECKVGFNGDGLRVCSDNNECLLNTTCHADAKCENTLGSYKCQCRDGFSGDGKICDDINECLGSGTHLCDSNANCINTKGSYDCKCKPGYQGDGFSCNNINECNLDDDEYPCDVNAECSDTTGSFYCTCKRGWTGNGTICNALGCIPPPYCSGEFKAAWWSRRPYLANSSSQEPVGLFKDILSEVVVSCCNNCSLLSFVGPYNGSFHVEEAIEGNTTVDFGCPLYGSPDQTLFRGYPFMSVVEAPGIAFFVKNRQEKENAVLGSLGSSWPILAITFLLACLSGIIIWFLDTVRNPKEFPNSFIGGSWEGFWWAFITMTTVGYGDKAPRSFGARLFGIIWILIGLVIISTFTATITTMLTASSLSNEIKLYGMKVGVLHNSEEYRLGVKRNAETKSFESVKDIVKNVKDDMIQGILLDAYIAGEFQDKLDDLRLHQVIDYIFSYGVVLSRDGLAMRQCFNHFLESKQSRIYSTISKVIKPLKQTKNAASLAAQKSASIFDSESPQFKYTIYAGLGAFVILFIVGVIWEYINSRRRKRSYSITETEEPKDDSLTEWKVQWDSGKISHFHQNIFKNDITDLKKHIKEFSDNWINKLDELEAKQNNEIKMVKNANPKVFQEKSRGYRIGKMPFKFPKGSFHNSNGNESHLEMLPK
eukprot:gene3191-3663_t